MWILPGHVLFVSSLPWFVSIKQEIGFLTYPRGQQYSASYRTLMSLWAIYEASSPENDVNSLDCCFYAVLTILSYVRLELFSSLIKNRQLFLSHAQLLWETCCTLPYPSLVSSASQIYIFPGRYCTHVHVVHSRRNWSDLNSSQMLKSLIWPWGEEQEFE